jgi:hypothetical protein
MKRHCFSYALRELRRVAACAAAEAVPESCEAIASPRRVRIIVEAAETPQLTTGVLDEIANVLGEKIKMITHLLPP